MKSSPKNQRSMSSLLCVAFGHDYIITRKVTNHINEYKCSHCGREVAENDTGHLEILTQKLKNTNSTLATFFQKKNRRVSV
jgi:CRISPR/Cas system-associated protein Cas10 (large subunit of type III CRISPR-Cas system)